MTALKYKWYLFFDSFFDFLMFGELSWTMSSNQISTMSPHQSTGTCYCKLYYLLFWILEIPHVDMCLNIYFAFLLKFTVSCSSLLQLHLWIYTIYHESSSVREVIYQIFCLIWRNLCCIEDLKVESLFKDPLTSWISKSSKKGNIRVIKIME